MDAARWTTLSALLDRAVDLPPPERDAWLAELRAADPAAASDVEAMLREGDDIVRGGFLENGAARPAAPGTDAAPSDVHDGRVVSAYTLERALGHGGMGAVWLAHRSDGRYDAKVAIKFLNAALIGRAAELRFRREGEVLARLSHPHITRLFDAGVTSDGQPYLVLEPIDGEPIDDWCDARKLGVEARLRLFLDVLAAVEHAHANLVIHRDIKPANVLVTRDGVVKLLDFGIAKLLDGDFDVTGKAALTREGDRVLTPEYAAPEQLTGQPVTVATDLYSLGVLLYALLVGRHPAGLAARPPAEIVRSIVDEPAERASDAVTPARGDASGDAAESALRRGLAPPALRQRLRGDLDSIVAKALEKDPARRYASATAFADDLSRHLANRPVLARPDALRYRAVKFVRRNRVVVALSSVAAVAAIAGLAGTTLQAQRATAERDFALKQLARATAVGDLDNFLLYNAAPSGKSFTGTELLTRAERIVESAADGPARTDLLLSIGGNYVGLDDYTDARRVLRQALDASLRQGDPILRARAECAWAEMLADSGAREDAARKFTDALGRLPDSPRYALDRVHCLQTAASAARRMGDAAAGVRDAEAARDVAVHLPFPAPQIEESVWEGVAESRRVAGDFAGADAAFAVAWARTKELGRDDTQAAGTLLNNWGIALVQMGEPLEAEPLLRHAIELSRSGPGDAGVSPVLLANEARALHQLGRDAEAKRTVDRAWSEARAHGDEVATNMALVMRAEILLAGGDLAGAEAVLDEVEPRLQRMLPPGHFAFAMVASERSMLAAARDDLPAAQRLADRAVDLAAADPHGGFALPIVLTRRAGLETGRGNPARAEADARRALAILEPGLPPGRASLHAGRAWLVLGRAEFARGDAAAAKRAFVTAVAQLQASAGADLPDTRLARELAARVPATVLPSG
ncbi:MAG: protein kinase [Proteobacteria bacterium]|nr:protein kinase [Pseudomonadota bacterium]